MATGSHHDAQPQLAVELEDTLYPNALYSDRSFPISHLVSRDVDEDDESRSGVSPISPEASPVERQSPSFAVQGNQQPPSDQPLALSEVNTTDARIYAAKELSSHRQPLDAGSRLPLLELQPATSKREHAIIEIQKYSSSIPPCTWLPFTLRWPFLVTLLLTAVILGIVAIALSAYSSHHLGLCDNSGSTGFTFVWRFLPTLIAVLYALAVTALTNDIKRTEAFAKLSMPEGCSASCSLLLSVGPWWKDPSRALSRKLNNGRRSWTLFWVSIANIMAMLLVSPLSAGVLSLIDVQISRNENFYRLELPVPLVPRNMTTDLTYFRAISSVVQNLKTSAWLTDEYAVLPFWPIEFTTAPFGPSLAGTTQQWQGETSVYQADLECIPMQVTSSNYSNYKLALDFQIITLKSTDGCTVNLNVSLSSGNSQTTGGWWSNTTANTFPIIANTQPPKINQTSTPECSNREMFFALSPLHTNRSGQPVDSYARLCSPHYFVADNVTATVTNTPDTSLVTIDEEAFSRTKVAIDSSVIDVQSLEAQFLDSSWSTYFQPPGGSSQQRPVYGGPLILLAASMTDRRTMGGQGSLVNAKAFDSETTLKQARKVRQRFFGEALQAIFLSLGQRDVRILPSTMTVKSTRLVVGYWISITLGVILLISGGMITFTLYCSRLRRRPLNLSRDPGTVAATTSMLLDDPQFRECFRGFDKLPENSMKTMLGTTAFRMVNGRLFLEKNENPQSLYKRTGLFQRRSRQARFLRTLGLTEATRLDDDWRPAILRRWTGLTLLAFLLGLAAALIALYAVSRGAGLYGSALVYRSKLSLSSNTVVGLAPYSIIPTIFAVAVKLWWGALEEIFKRLQPYVVMARAPTRGRRGLARSYSNCPQILASMKAFSRGHWLLALVCLGAFWTEIFTVGMSALWQRNVRSFPSLRQIPTQLELRAIPEVFLVPVNAEPTNTFQLPVLTQIFQNPFESWLYGAVIQIAYNGSQPPWSLDGWSFAPIDLSSAHITSQQTVQKRTQFRSPQDPELTDPQSPTEPNTNVTFETPAIKARIECSPWETLSNTSSWLQSWDLQDSSFWNVSINPQVPDRGYELRTRVDLTAEMETTTFANPSRLTCCANVTQDRPGLASIGYWSVNSMINSRSSQASEKPGNFSIKWIVGHLIAQPFVDQDNKSHLIWQDVPGIAALNCKPIIESAHSSVTVDVANGAVRNFSILDDPVEASYAWNDNYEGHRSTDPETQNSFSSKQNVTVSYGRLFMDAIANAADIARLGEGELSLIGYGDEDLSDKTFNFRLPGLNVNYMSYAAYALAQQKPEALLDPSTLQNLANSAFSTFFQHYAATDVSLAAGGRVFQTIGAELPYGLPPIPNGTHLSSHQDSNIPTSSDRSLQVTLHRQVNELVMSLTAVILCLAILVFLACVTLLVYIPYAAYFKALPRDVETLASVIAFIYDSPKLRQWVAASEHLLDAKQHKGRLWNRASAERGAYRSTTASETQGTANDLDEITTGLGFFRGEQGIARWGVEIEPLVHTNPKAPHTALVADEMGI